VPKYIGLSITVTNCILLSALFGKYIDNKNYFRVDYTGHNYALFTAMCCEICTILKYPRNYKYESISCVPYLRYLSLSETIQR
jgi:hypothetical protein